MRIEDIPLYASVIRTGYAFLYEYFTLLKLIGLGFFNRVIYREYQKIQRAKKCADCIALIIAIVRAVVVRPISNKP